MIAGTSISGRQVARELTSIIARRGKPGSIISDLGTQRAAFRPEGPRFCAGLAERLRFGRHSFASPGESSRSRCDPMHLEMNSVRKSEPDRRAEDRPFPHLALRASAVTEA
jgi:hypothetical protein